VNETRPWIRERRRLVHEENRSRWTSSSWDWSWSKHAMDRQSIYVMWHESLHLLCAFCFYYVNDAVNKWIQQKPVSFVVLRPDQIKVSDGSAEHAHNVTWKLTCIVCLLLALQILVLNTIMKYDYDLAELVKDEF
jgi:hypothetical protein